MIRTQDRRTAWYPAATLGLWAMAVLVALGMNHLGKEARVFRSPEEAPRPVTVVVVRDAAGSIDAWRDSGYRGRVLVHVGRYLHFVAPGAPYTDRRLAAFPHAVEAMILQHAGDPGMLWILMRLNIARELVHVVPAEVYDDKLGTGGDPGRRSTVLSDHGLKRTLAYHLQDYGEPVLLSLDASLFGTEDGERLATALLEDPPDSDLVVLNLAEDNPRVGAGQRQALLRFADALRERVSGP